MNQDLLDEKESNNTAQNYLYEPKHHFYIIVGFMLIVVGGFLFREYGTDTPLGIVTARLLGYMVLGGGAYYFVLMLIGLGIDAMKVHESKLDVVKDMIYIPIIALLGSFGVIMFLLVATGFWYFLFGLIWHFVGHEPNLMEGVLIDFTAILLGLCTIHAVLYHSLYHRLLSR